MINVEREYIKIPVLKRGECMALRNSKRNKDTTRRETMEGREDVKHDNQEGKEYIKEKCNDNIIKSA